MSELKEEDEERQAQEQAHCAERAGSDSSESWLSFTARRRSSPNPAMTRQSTGGGNGPESNVLRTEACLHRIARHFDDRFAVLDEALSTSHVKMDQVGQQGGAG